MDLGQIEAFVQVARRRSFSKAAQALFLTQPSVSARIQALERDLGDPLFERDGRGVRLTDVGTAFLPHAERVLKALQEGRDAMDGLRRLDIGALRLGCSPTVGTYVLPGLLKRFRERYPGVQVSVRAQHSYHVLQMLLSDEVQVAITRSLTHADVAAVLLYEDDVLLVTNPSHRFVALGEVTLEDIGREPLILFDPASSYRGLIQGLFDEGGVLPTAGMELDSMEAAKKMVEEGVGIALLPRSAVERELELGFLREVKLRDVTPPRRRIALIYRRGRRPSRATLAFIALLRDRYGFAWPDDLPAL